MTVCKLSVWPVIGALFHPAYTIVNAAVCGRLGDPVYLSGFGLGSLTLGIGAIAILICFSMGLGTVVGQANGSKDYALARVYLYRQYFLNCIMFAIITVPMIFIRSIYSAIGQDEEIAELATKYVRIVFPFLIFHSQSFANF
jgi:Na+-driven multidrug efflux pump